MRKSNFAVKSVNGSVLWNNPALMLRCDPEKGITLVARRLEGFRTKEEPVLRIDPDEARYFRVGDGPRSAWTGGHPGVWDAQIYSDDGGATVFRMNNGHEAAALCKWVERYARRKAERRLFELPVCEQLDERLAKLSADARAEQYRAYLANLCYRLSYLRGRETVEEVDCELAAIVSEMQAVLGGVKDL